LSGGQLGLTCWCLAVLVLVTPRPAGARAGLGRWADWPFLVLSSHSPGHASWALGLLERLAVLCLGHATSCWQCELAWPAERLASFGRRHSCGGGSRASVCWSDWLSLVLVEDTSCWRPELVFAFAAIGRVLGVGRGTSCWATRAGPGRWWTRRSWSAFFSRVLLAAAGAGPGLLERWVVLVLVEATSCGQPGVGLGLLDAIGVLGLVETHFLLRR